MDIILLHKLLDGVRKPAFAQQLQLLPAQVLLHKNVHTNAFRCTLTILRVHILDVLHVNGSICRNTPRSGLFSAMEDKYIAWVRDPS